MKTKQTLKIEDEGWIPQRDRGDLCGGVGGIGMTYTQQFVEIYFGGQDQGDRPLPRRCRSLERLMAEGWDGVRLATRAEFKRKHPWAVKVEGVVIHRFTNEQLAKEARAREITRGAWRWGVGDGGKVVVVPTAEVVWEV